jgi:asparagine synthase (glutamine-hydrolysing)
MDPDAVLCHERLAIVDPNGEAQPLYNEDRSLVLSVNGEIYNHKELREKFCQGMAFRTASDCEPLVHMYERMGPELVQHLDGDFSFVLWDSKKKQFLAARDPLGVNTLYYGYDANQVMWFASELK